MIGSQPASLLSEAASRWGTPLWVLDLGRASVNLATYRSALPGALIAYAVKANADPQLVRRLVAEGAGCEVVGSVELALATRAGCPPERIVMNGVGRTDPELAEALAAGALVNAESLDDLEVLIAAARQLHTARQVSARIGLRINPELDASTHPHLATGARTAKFGIAREDLGRSLGMLRAADLSLAALGAHIGSDVPDASAHAALARILADAEREAAAIGLAPERIDVGGGLASADPAQLGVLAEAVERHLGGSRRLICEPGRSLVVDAGWLLTRVVRVQPRAGASLTYLVADAGMTDLIRPVLYGAHHPVWLVEPGEALAPGPAGAVIHLAGPVCEASDVLVRDLGRWLDHDAVARAGRGALLAIGHAGAYGAAMSMTYNGRPRAAEAVIEGSELRLSRRRERLEDFLARDLS